MGAWSRRLTRRFQPSRLVVAYCGTCPLEQLALTNRRHRPRQRVLEPRRRSVDEPWNTKREASTSLRVKHESISKPAAVLISGNMGSEQILNHLKCVANQMDFLTSMFIPQPVSVASWPYCNFRQGLEYYIMLLPRKELNDLIFID